jgi:hypothetical protein
LAIGTGQIDNSQPLPVPFGIGQRRGLRAAPLAWDPKKWNFSWDATVELVCFEWSFEGEFLRPDRKRLYEPPSGRQAYNKRDGPILFMGFAQSDRPSRA